MLDSPGNAQPFREDTKIICSDLHIILKGQKDKQKKLHNLTKYIGDSTLNDLALYFEKIVYKSLF